MIRVHSSSANHGNKTGETKGYEYKIKTKFAGSYVADFLGGAEWINKPKSCHDQYLHIRSHPITTVY